MQNKIFDLIKKEEQRQRETLMMIPSENYASHEVLAAVGSVLQNKYAEGYPGKRFYQGMKYVDELENYTIDLAKKVFGVPFANVQPYSGSPMNSEVYFALLEPGECLMGLALASGGHLTHGHPKVTFAGKYFKSVQYDLQDKPPYFDFNKIRELAHKHKPKIIVAGTTAFPRIIDWKQFAEIADEIGAWLMADISHIAGLVVAGTHPSPVPYFHIVTTTTHKTLRGPRGGLILVTEKGMKKDVQLGDKINKAVFPGFQGGPHMNTIAGIAIALEENLKPEFKKYGEQIVKNARVLADVFRKNGVSMVTGGTDNHLILIDLVKSNFAAGSGLFAAEALEAAGIVINKNTIPNEPFSAFYPSGVRLGTPAITTRGMKEKEMENIGKWIVEVLNLVKKYEMPRDKLKRAEYIAKFRKEIIKSDLLHRIKENVKILTSKFPIN
jgi:glycine hydroxymethyltransferase